MNGMKILCQLKTQLLVSWVEQKGEDLLAQCNVYGRLHWKCLCLDLQFTTDAGAYTGWYAASNRGGLEQDSPMLVFSPTSRETRDPKTHS